jgi:hypothetical protein
MTARQPRYSKEEFARRGEAIYESEIRLKVEAESSEILKQYASKVDSERFREILARVPNVVPMPGDELE